MAIVNERAIFDAALQLEDRAEREAYLDRECHGDPELRKHVERLLDAFPKLHDFLESPVTPPKSYSDPTARPGDVIGNYKLLQQVGEGGFGVVYMAEQQQPVRRKVALKIIKAGMDSREVTTRFEAERQALAMMDHPNIARVLEAGTTESGRPYFVMDLVRGSPITEYCDQNQVPLSDRLKLFIPVCRAIQHAHQKGVIHRDIKPSNVMVTLSDGEPTPKVIDFGVAKAIDHRLTERTMFTRFGQVVGTLEYMSPEQAEMGGLDIDTRSDIYSLGVVLYELLTGSTPLERSRMREAAFDEVLRMIREDEPITPSNRISQSGDALVAISAQRRMEPKKLGAFVRGELDWVVMKALEKNRSRRFATANELADDIEHFLRGEPVTACPPSLAYRLGKYGRRHLGLITGTAFLLVVLLLAAPLSIWHAMRATRSERIANRERDLAEKAGLEARGARDAEAKAKTALLDAYQQLSAEQTRTQIAHQRAIRNEARLAAEKGHGLVEQRKFREALLWLNRAWEHMPADETILRQAILFQAAALRHELPRPGLVPIELQNDFDAFRYVAEVDREGSVLIAQSASEAAGSPARQVFRLVPPGESGNLDFLGTSHRGSIGFLAGGKLLTLAGGKPMQRWDVASGRYLDDIGSADHNAMGRFHIDPTGTRIFAIRGDARQAALIDAESGKTLRDVHASAGRYLFTAQGGYGPFSPDGRALVVLDLPASILGNPQDTTTAFHRIDASTGEAASEARPFRGASDSSRGVRYAVGPGAETLVMAIPDPRTGQPVFTRYDVAAGRTIEPSWGDASGLGAMALSADGLLLATTVSHASGRGMHARIWRLQPQPRVVQEFTLPAPLERLRFDAHDHLLTLGAFPMYRWSVEGSRLRQPLYPHGAAIQSIAVNDSEETVATISARQVVRWHASKAERISPPLDLPLGDSRGRSMTAFTRDGRYIAVADGAAVQRWNLGTGQPDGVQISLPSEVMHLVFNAAGDRILCVCALDNTKGEVHVVDAVSGKSYGRPIPCLCIFDWEPHRKGMSGGAVAISPDGSSVLVTDRLGRLRRWDAGGIRAAPDPIDIGESITDVEFTPDGRNVLVVANHQTVELREAVTGQRVGQPVRLNRPLRAFAMSADSQVLATATENEIRCWFLPTGQPLGTAITHARVTALCFSTDHRVLLAGDERGHVRSWEAFDDMSDPGMSRMTVEALTGMQLSDEGHVEFLDARQWAARLSQLDGAGPPARRALTPLSPILETALDVQSAADWQLLQAGLDQRAGEADGWLARLFRARAALELDAEEQAEAEVRLAWEAGPGPVFAEWLKNFANVERLHRHPDRARWFLDHAIGLDLADASVYLAQAELCMAEKRGHEANSWLQQTVDAQPNSSALLRSVGEIDFQLENWEVAASRFSRALELGGGSAEVWQLRAACYAELGRWDEAAEDLDKCVQRHPRNGEWRERLAISLVSAGKLAEYRELCADTLANFDFADYQLRVWTAPTLLTLAPDGLRDYQRIIGPAQDFADKYRDDCVSYHVLGPYCYRAREYARAARATPARNSQQAVRADELIFLAMATAQLGDISGAQAKLEEVSRLPWQQSTVWQRQRMRILLDEADTLLREKEAVEVEVGK